MRKIFLGVFTLALVSVSCNNDDETPVTYEEIVAVANRGAASVSLIDATTNKVTNTISISGSEPMYVVYVAAKDKLYVGDRAGKKVHIINPKSKTVEGTINVGNGVFHMWADGLGKQLWVNNDTANTISVIDLNNNTVVKTINVGMKPHDIFLTKDATKAYVSVFNTDASMPDKIYSYSISDYSKTGEVNVGKDPHLYHLPNSNKLFVPCQSGQVYTLNGSDLSVTSNNSFTGAHGIFPSPDQNTIFVTNISGGQLYAINTATNTLIGSSVNSTGSTPHNITINEGGNKMFISHSGAAANTVSTYTLNGSTITAGSTITVGTNPFGITYYKRAVN